MAVSPEARAAVAEASAGGVKLVPGGAVELLSLKDTAAVVEGRTRLAVGSTVSLCLGGASPRKVPAKVVRCNVSAIHRDSTMSYQLDLALTEAVPGAETIDAAPAAGASAAVAGVSPIAADRPVVVEDLVNEW